MRTTLTLDADVAIQLKKLCAKRDEKWRTVVNQALRIGLQGLSEVRRKGHRPYRTEPVSLGRPRLPNLDNIAEVLAVADGDEHP